MRDFAYSQHPFYQLNEYHDSEVIYVKVYYYNDNLNAVINFKKY